MAQGLPNFMALYEGWKRLPTGSRAELRRVAKPDDLISVPGFYRLFSGQAATEWEKQAFQRLIYILPHITHFEADIGLGKALAKGKNVSEKRLFQIVRSDSPNDVIQLRRILQMIEPAVNWPKAAKLLWYWNDRSKRDLLEDYFINQPK